MNHPTMPDPFSSHAQGVNEIPIREVISRLASIVGGPLAEYVAEASGSHVLGSAADDVTAALDHLLTLWDERDCLEVKIEANADRVTELMEDLAARVEQAREARKNRPQPRGAPAPIGAYPGRPDLEERAERKRAEFITSKPLPRRELTPDQIEAGERHARLQAGGES